MWLAILAGFANKTFSASTSKERIFPISDFEAQLKPAPKAAKISSTVRLSLHFTAKTSVTRKTSLCTSEILTKKWLDPRHFLFPQFVILNDIVSVADEESVVLCFGDLVDDGPHFGVGVENVKSFALFLVLHCWVEINWLNRLRNDVVISKLRKKEVQWGDLCGFRGILTRQPALRIAQVCV